MATFGKTTQAPQEKKTYEAIPEKTYPAEVVRMTVKPIDLEKTPWLDKRVERGIDSQISFGFKITSGDYAGRWLWSDVDAEISDWSGCKLRLYLQELLGGLDELPDGYELDEEDFPDYIGLQCRIRVTKKQNKKGEWKNYVDDVLAPSNAQVAAIATPTYEDESPF